MDKTQITVRLSDQALAHLDEISNHYGFDRTSAITMAAAEWANVLRKRERKARRQIKGTTEPHAVNSSSPP